MITKHVIQAVPEIQKLSAGLLHVFLLHTSASLTLNENADPDVPQDLESSLNTIVPETLPYRHTLEGPDDMPAHVKTSFSTISLDVLGNHTLVYSGVDPFQIHHTW